MVLDFGLLIIAACTLSFFGLQRLYLRGQRPRAAVISRRTCE
jgi:hypothetical protein